MASRPAIVLAASVTRVSKSWSSTHSTPRRAPAAPSRACAIRRRQSTASNLGWRQARRQRRRAKKVWAAPSARSDRHLLPGKLLDELDVRKIDRKDFDTTLFEQLREIQNRIDAEPPVRAQSPRSILGIPDPAARRAHARDAECRYRGGSDRCGGDRASTRAAGSRLAAASGRSQRRRIHRLSAARRGAGGLSSRLSSWRPTVESDRH